MRLALLGVASVKESDEFTVPEYYLLDRLAHDEMHSKETQGQASVPPGFLGRARIG